MVGRPIAAKQARRCLKSERAASAAVAHDRVVLHLHGRDVTHRLGTFESEEEAAEAYDKAAKRRHGARAKLNF
jgi:2,3-bisphosphoglycerate-independent phosphoglycerate mutase